MSTISPTTGRPTTPHTTAKPDSTDLRIASQTNRILGQFTVRRDDELQHIALVAGRHVGSRTGYSSVENAVRATQFLTTIDEHADPNTASVGILRQNDRFYAYQLLERNLDDGLRSPTYRAAFESRLADMQSFRTVHRDTQLEALVDGDFVHRFRG